eukprot:224639-Pleurochrysis_carterae.AAC.1
MVGDNPASDMEGARRANIFHKANAEDGVTGPNVCTAGQRACARADARARTHTLPRRGARAHVPYSLLLSHIVHPMLCPRLVLIAVTVADGTAQ